LRCPDLITSDVRLAEGCGIDAVEAICRERAIPTLFITGTAQDAEARVGGAVVLNKPFTAATLNRALERVLGGAGS
jgi:CheY-like chemotaxis protein